MEPKCLNRCFGKRHRQLFLYVTDGLTSECSHCSKRYRLFDSRILSRTDDSQYTTIFLKVGFDARKYRLEDVKSFQTFDENLNIIQYKLMTPFELKKKEFDSSSDVMKIV